MSFQSGRQTRRACFVADGAVDGGRLNGQRIQLQEPPFGAAFLRRGLICSGLFNPNGDIKMRYAFCRCAMSRKYYRLLKSSLRGRDPFFNVVTLIVVEIVALAYAATVLAHAASA
jgi:hypothetical protein